MISRKSTARIAALVLALMCHEVRSDVANGVAAYQRGDFATAFQEFIGLAEQDDIYAQNVIGIMYAEGQGVQRNDRMAANWFFKAQVLGSLEASANLGRMYSEGRGVPQDNRAALRNYRDAALGGYQPAMQRLIEIYENGELGVKPDPAQAIEWRTRLSGSSGERVASARASEQSPAPAVERSSARKTAVAPIAKPPKLDVAAPPPLASDEQFEKEVFERLEKYRQRERKLLVASTDDAPSLAAYLKDLRTRLKSQLETVYLSPRQQQWMTVTLSILEDGTLRDIELDQGSGDARADRRVLSLLRKLDRLAPLPKATTEVADVLGVTVKLPID